MDSPNEQTKMKRVASKNAEISSTLVIHHLLIFVAGPRVLSRRSWHWRRRENVSSENFRAGRVLRSEIRPTCTQGGEEHFHFKKERNVSVWKEKTIMWPLPFYYFFPFRQFSWPLTHDYVGRRKRRRNKQRPFPAEQLRSKTPLSRAEVGRVKWSEMVGRRASASALDAHGTHNWPQRAAAINIFEFLFV